MRTTTRDEDVSHCRTSISKWSSSSCSSRTRSTSPAAALASCSSCSSHESGTGWLQARSHAMEAGERPNWRTTVAAAASGRTVQWRMRPAEEGSTTPAGMEERKSEISASYSGSVMWPAVTLCLETERVVAPMPAALRSFQTGEVEPPSERP